MSGISPTQRSRNLLTAQGYLVANVEQWKRFPKYKSKACPACGKREQIAVRSDLLGFADLIAFHPIHRSVLLVQVTTARNRAARRNKILASMEAKLAILAGCCVIIQSWSDVRHTEESGKLMKRAWEVTEEQIHLDSYDQAPHYPDTVEQLTALKRKAKRPDIVPGEMFKQEGLKDEEMPF